MRYIFLLLFLTLAFWSCKKKKVDQAAEDDKKLKQYISDKNLNATATGSGLYYVITSQGTGVQPTSSSNVKIKYKGYLIDGTVFDQSTNIGASFNLGSVIKGWQEGVPLFKKGGKGTLLIPSTLGYGNQAQGSIPANSVLIFDIELLDVS